MGTQSTAGSGLSARAAIDVALPSSAVSRAPSNLELTRYVFSFPMLLASLLVAAVFVPARLFGVDPDTWWHIKVGEAILATHHFPTVDTYSFTVSGQPWIAYEWLGDALWAAVMHLGGLVGLEVLLMLLGSAVMLALYAYTTLCSGNSKAGFVACAILFVFANASFTLRPQMLGYLFLILTLIVLELFRQGHEWAIWFLPLIFLVWVNTHGSFVIGLGAVLVYWLGGLKQFRVEGIETHQWSAAERRSISLAFLLSLAVLPITPYFTQLAAYPFDMAFSQPVNVANIQEWRSMPFSLPAGKIFLALLIGLIVCQIVLRITWRLEELTLCLLGIIMACLHVRFVLVFVPFAAPVLSKIFARWVPAYDRAKDRVLLNAAIMAVLLGSVVHFMPSASNLQQIVAEHSPSRAVEYLKAHPVPGPMFNNYGYGGYLVWKLAPEQKVFIDGRADVYERGGVLADYMQITMLKPGAIGILDNYGVRSALLERDEPLATVLGALPDWHREYADGQSVLFVRQVPIQ